MIRATALPSLPRLMLESDHSIRFLKATLGSIEIRKHDPFNTGYCMAISIESELPKHETAEQEIVIERQKNWHNTELLRQVFFI